MQAQAHSSWKAQQVANRLQLKLLYSFTLILKHKALDVELVWLDAACTTFTCTSSLLQGPAKVLFAQGADEFYAWVLGLPQKQ